MTKKVLTAAAAMECKRLRAELNDWGEPAWTGAQIAVRLGVSEATVWRALKKQAAYAKLRDLPTQEDADRSLEILQQMLAAGPPKEVPDAFDNAIVLGDKDE